MTLFIGHHAVAFASHRRRHFLDLIWPVFLLLGWEAAWIFPFWAAWFDGHRSLRT